MINIDKHWNSSRTMGPTPFHIFTENHSTKKCIQ